MLLFCTKYGPLYTRKRIYHITHAPACRGAGQRADGRGLGGRGTAPVREISRYDSLRGIKAPARELIKTGIQTRNNSGLEPLLYMWHVAHVVE